MKYVYRLQLRLVSIKDTVLVSLAAVSDLSYAFQIITDYIDLMHLNICRNPFAVLSLRNLFLKLVSALNPSESLSVGTTCFEPEIFTIFHETTLRYKYTHRTCIHACLELSNDISGNISCRHLCLTCQWCESCKRARIISRRWPSITHRSL